MNQRPDKLRAMVWRHPSSLATNMRTVLKAGKDPFRPLGDVLACRRLATASLLGGPWVVISRVVSPLIWVITTVSLLITPLIPTQEPPSKVMRRQATGENLSFRVRGLAQGSRD